jgi:hypothetical protein
MRRWDASWNVLKTCSLNPPDVLPEGGEQSDMMRTGTGAATPA